jgi:hypothetical protein
VCDYLLLLIARKVYRIDQDLYIISQAIGFLLFEQIIKELFNQVDAKGLEHENSQ